jgi:hypothetical protein
MALSFSRNSGEKLQSFWNIIEIDGSEDFMISDINNESESNDNGDDSSIGSDSEWHKHVSELLIDDTI